jgi:hypothetical protein
MYKTVNIEQSKFINVYRILSIILIGFFPIIAHVTKLPLYYLEPMRIMIVIFFIRGYMKDAFMFSILYPIISFFISGHPMIYKMPLVMIDLFLNILIFYILTRKDINIYISFIVSVVISKILYYVLKYMIFTVILAKLQGLIETNVLIQGINILGILILIKFANKKATDA